MRPTRYVPFLTLAVLALIWGYSWVPSKLGVANSSAFEFAAMRTFPAGVVMVALLPVLGRPFWPKAWRLTAVVGVLQLCGFAGLTSAALVVGGAGHTAMLANTWQFWLLLIAWIFLSEKIRGGQWVSVALGLVGLVLIIEPWALHGVLPSLLALAGALCFAAGAIVVKVLRRRHKVDLFSLSAWQTLFGSIPLVVIALLVPGDGIEWNATLIWSMLYCAFISAALGNMLWLFILNRMPANMAGIGTIGTPVVGVLASYFQLGEDLSRPEIAGMVLVVLALGLLGLWGLRGAKGA